MAKKEKKEVESFKNMSCGSASGVVTGVIFIDLIKQLLFIYTIYLSFVINKGFNLLHFLLACFCWPFYLAYALFKTKFKFKLK
jgi:hypothetical protein